MATEWESSLCAEAGEQFVCRGRKVSRVQQAKFMRESESVEYLEALAQSAALCAPGCCLERGRDWRFC